eukprot:TRINITY_DN15224_c0_g1_i3.p3 TRINITY_DN15224_c0_g1~~TRINITY_DN15224_c0_g1_i3.p3  ORF type:complete len:179 (+),score=44.02 TRINITY_DN15224_c0_g1_i3:161-697(+)
MCIRDRIEPIERARLTGVLTKDETQKGYLALADGKLYKVQKAAVTYFRGEYGDSLTILVPKGKNSTWAAIENIVKENEPLSYKEGHFDNKEEEMEVSKLASEQVSKSEKEEEKIEEIKKVSPKKELSLNDIKPIRLEDLEQKVILKLKIQKFKTILKHQNFKFKIQICFQTLPTGRQV